MVGLKDKVIGMYPEIKKPKIACSLVFSGEKNAYIVKFQKGHHKLITHLEEKDSEACMDGINYVSLGVQVSEFIKNYEAGAALTG